MLTRLAWMLERVPLLEKELAHYAGIVGDEPIAQIREAAEPLEGARVLHVSATAYGGGVAELLATHVPLLRSIGIDAEWQVLHGSDEFFAVTKQVHNALQGADIEWTPHMQKIYLERILDNSLMMDDAFDVIVVHDPQPAALLHFLRDHPSFSNDRTRWIWRCHIDLTVANPTVWEFFRPFVELHDASVWTLAEFVPASLKMERVVELHPCIDPLSVKNLDLARPFCEELTRQYGIDTKRPIVCQVSRFDPWKDPIGVVEAFRIVREQVPDAQLLLAGSMATDDPEGFRVWEETEQARAGDRDIHLLSNLHQVGSVQINAFQRIATVMVQKSLREGFGLTVSEALWKGRPVVGGRAGGIKLQVIDDFTGFLVDSVEGCAQRIIDLLADPVGADAMGSQGREHVRANFLATTELHDWLLLLSELR
ncbi:MAG TPA: glycosyltransferase [Acidimicrobiia bacterium]|nr:glycosyltransferase [Acidimicrobiia bacterium]